MLTDLGARGALDFDGLVRQAAHELVSFTDNPSRNFAKKTNFRAHVSMAIESVYFLFHIGPFRERDLTTYMSKIESVKLKLNKFIINTYQRLI